jgi:hypothetical protein
MRPFLSAKQNGTAIARAHDLALLWIEQVLVNGSQLRAAKLAAFRRRGSAGKLPEKRRCPVALRILNRFFHHRNPVEPL